MCRSDLAGVWDCKKLSEMNVRVIIKDRQQGKENEKESMCQQ